MTNTPEWNDPAVYEWGTEPAHASLTPYETHAQAVRADRLDSPYPPEPRRRMEVPLVGEPGGEDA